MQWCAYKDKREGPHSATILFVECTLTDNNKGNKIGKFIQKVNLLRDEFEGYEITTVIMSPFGKQGGKSITKAVEYEIAVLLMKDIRTLIQYAHQYATTQSTIDMIKKKIPLLQRDRVNPMYREQGFF